MKSIQERIEQLEEKFNQFSSWEDKYKEIIQMGKALPDLDEKYRVESNKVKGCQSQVWLACELEDGKINFFADSDASIVKGIIAVLLSVYSGATPDEILVTKPDFIDKVGLRQHLSMSRANGLNSMIKQIGLYALALKTKAQMEGGL